MSCYLSVTSATSQLILQPFRRFTYVILKPFCYFTYVTAHSPTLQSLYLRHNSFSNPSVALPTSQLVLQSFRCFTYATAHSPTLLSLLLRHRLFTYVTWRAAHGTLVATEAFQKQIKRVKPSQYTVHAFICLPLWIQIPPLLFFPPPF